jgi:hypothetical protein
VSFSAVWNILAATRAIFFLFAEAIDDILDLALFAFLLLSRRVCFTLQTCVVFLSKASEFSHETQETHLK